ncbi:FAD-dependent oxidoreductase [Alicyclobacillus tolerans]|uniref:FAD-dependent oxidoreductase n=1 Tax=Alicyclobacillus tolerans TaxID=90970 RepID=UPI001F26AFB8|nr:FAD-dependent oxidoreductase [Alicyclobacillus tolerans]MCF8567331.1 FAD-dependent oxidoreductase [Alicyclobacillus tolerans]
MRVRGEYDVVVCGAGTAGVISAIGASRSGARTLLVEQYGSVGGILSLGMALLGSADAEGFKALGGIGGELVETLKKSSGSTDITVDPLFGSVLGHDPELTKLLLLKMAEEAGVHFLLHSFVVETLMDGTTLKGILVANKGGLEVIHGKAFVDCTGDADVVARANGEFTFGREKDSLAQPVSSIFRVGGVNLDKTWDYLDTHPEDMSTPDGWSGESYSRGFLRQTPGATIEGFRSLILKAQEAGDYHIPRDRLGINTFPNRSEVTINITRVHGIDGTNPDHITHAEIESQKQMFEAIGFLRKYVPGFENCHIVSTPYQVGVRESRHIKGDYVLTKEDVMEGRDFSDQIGRGAYPLDVHDVKPGDESLGRSVSGGGVTLWKIPRSYGIPARCLIPKGLNNVTVGGRAISATHEAAGSVRGQAVGMVTGHAAGVIAALASLNSTTTSGIDIAEVQTMLKGQGAILERTVPVV